VVAELAHRGWAERDWAQRRQTDAEKVQIAPRLRGETVRTLDWIAARLRMGCQHTLANRLKGESLSPIAGTDTFSTRKSRGNTYSFPMMR
jgi:hypothetical protein